MVVYQAISVSAPTMVGRDQQLERQGIGNILTAAGRVELLSPGQRDRCFSNQRGRE